MAAWSGEWDVEALASRLTPEQMDRWEVFDEREPIGMAEIYRLLAMLIQYTAAKVHVSLTLDEICPWLGRDI